MYTFKELRAHSTCESLLYNCLIGTDLESVLLQFCYENRNTKKDRPTNKASVLTNCVNHAMWNIGPQS